MASRDFETDRDREIREGLSSGDIIYLGDVVEGSIGPPLPGGVDDGFDSAAKAKVKVFNGLVERFGDGNVRTGFAKNPKTKELTGVDNMSGLYLARTAVEAEIDLAIEVAKAAPKKL